MYSHPCSQQCNTNGPCPFVQDPGNHFRYTCLTCGKVRWVNQGGPLTEGVGLVMTLGAVIFVLLLAFSSDSEPVPPGIDPSPSPNLEQVQQP